MKYAMADLRILRYNTGTSDKLKEYHREAFWVPEDSEVSESESESESDLGSVSDPSPSVSSLVVVKGLGDCSSMTGE